MRVVLSSTKRRCNRGNRDITHAQESKLKQLLICYSKSPSKKVVALLQEEIDMREGEMRESSRSILVALVAGTEYHE
jgi:hypothetical protein